MEGSCRKVSDAPMFMDFPAFEGGNAVLHSFEDLSNHPECVNFKYSRARDLEVRIFRDFRYFLIFSRIVGSMMTLCFRGFENQAPAMNGVLF
jgi:hypothetical protein